MKKKWITKQDDMKDCGAACLSSIIKYYDGFVDMETLRDKTLTDRTGTSAYHIINAAISLGFDSSGLKCNEQELKNITLPCIAHIVTKDNTSHFIVIYKLDYSKNIMIVMDPAYGYQKLKIEEFIAMWTNIIIIFYPKNKIPKLPKQTSIKKLFITIIPTEKYFIHKILLTTIILTLITIILSFYFKVAINNIDTFYSKKSLFTISFIFFIVYILKFILNYLRDLYEIYFNKNLDIKIVIPFLNHLFSLPLNYVKNKTVGEITKRVDELNNIKDLFSKVFIHLVVDLFLAIFAIIILININIKLFFILLVVLLLYIIIGVIFSPIIYQKAIKNIEYETRFRSSLVENINGYETIKNLNKSTFKVSDLENKYVVFLKDLLSFNKTIVIQNLFKNFISEIGIFSCSVFGFYLYLNESITIADIITFNTILYYLLDPIKNTIDLLPQINYIKASYTKIGEFINLKEEELSTHKESFKTGDIVFENVKYSYNHLDYILNNINLKVKSKDKIILVGKSGSGKTTLCKLLFRIDKLSGGKIKIGNVNIEDYKLNTIRENISYLSQSEKLFTDTIYNNIVFGQEVSMEKINEISKVCKIEDILEKKALRFETLIEDEGFNLSGGERQRIILARTLLKNSKILILDESLSEVEINMEREIIKNILSYCKDKTLIYISHRNHEKYFNRVINLNEINEI